MRQELAGVVDLHQQRGVTEIADAIGDDAKMLDVRPELAVRLAERSGRCPRRIGLRRIECDADPGDEFAHCPDSQTGRSARTLSPVANLWAEGHPGRSRGQDSVVLRRPTTGFAECLQTL